MLKYYYEKTMTEPCVIFLDSIIADYYLGKLHDSTSYVKYETLPGGRLAGLASNDKTCYRYGFVVLEISPNNMFGGINIGILLKACPERVFIAWVAKEDSQWQLRTFIENKTDESMIKFMQLTFNEIIKDTSDFVNKINIASKKSKNTLFASNRIPLISAFSILCLLLATFFIIKQKQRKQKMEDEKCEDEIVLEIKSPSIEKTLEPKSSQTSEHRDDSETVTDADGNVYHTVKIGNQVWTVENLKTTKYNDGTVIPLVADNSIWSSYDHDSKPAYCWYDDNINYKGKYGALYNWHAVNTGKLAPKGWHVPSNAEWTELEEYLIANGYNWDGTKEGNKIAKSMASQADWKSRSDPGTIGNDLSENNRSGFSALPGGCRYGDGSFNDGIGSSGHWWSATAGAASYSWRRNLVRVGLGRDNYAKGCGCSVRLLRDIEKTLQPKPHQASEVAESDEKMTQRFLNLSGDEMLRMLRTGKFSSEMELKTLLQTAGMFAQITPGFWDALAWIVKDESVDPYVRETMDDFFTSHKF